MERRKMTYLVGTALVLIFATFFIYSQIVAQNDDTFTQGDFVVVLIQVMGLESELPNQPGETPQEQGMNLLMSLGCMPWGGWNADAICTKGDVDLVLALALGYVDPPENWFEANREMCIAEAFNTLSEHGIYITGVPIGKPEDPISKTELAAVINAASDVTGSQINPYPVPVSPTQ